MNTDEPISTDADAARNTVHTQSPSQGQLATTQYIRDSANNKIYPGGTELRPVSVISHSQQALADDSGLNTPVSNPLSVEARDLIAELDGVFHSAADPLNTDRCIKETVNIALVALIGVPSAPLPDRNTMDLLGKVRLWNKIGQELDFRSMANSETCLIFFIRGAYCFWVRTYSHFKQSQQG